MGLAFITIGSDMDSKYAQMRPNLSCFNVDLCGGKIGHLGPCQKDFWGGWGFWLVLLKPYIKIDDNVLHLFLEMDIFPNGFWVTVGIVRFQR